MDINGHQKAAIIFLLLVEQHSVRIAESFSDDELKDISKTMSSLGIMETSVIEQVIAEFTQKVFASSSIVGSMDATEKMLAKILPYDKANAIMDEIRGPNTKSMWDHLANINENNLASYFKQENPQTVAFILSKIKPVHAAKILALFEQNFAMDVVSRLLYLEPVQKEIADNIETTLRKEFMANINKTYLQDPFDIVADIFNNLNKKTETTLLAKLFEIDNGGAEKVRSLMFTFDDIAVIDNAGIQMILKSINKNKLPLALKAASNEIKTLFLGNMSERAAKLLKDDIDLLGPVRVRDVEDAQNSIVQVARELINDGKIIFSRNNEENRLIH